MKHIHATPLEHFDHSTRAWQSYVTSLSRAEREQLGVTRCSCGCFISAGDGHNCSKPPASASAPSRTVRLAAAVKRLVVQAPSREARRGEIQTDYVFLTQCADAGQALAYWLGAESVLSIRGSNVDDAYDKLVDQLTLHNVRLGNVVLRYDRPNCYLLADWVYDL